MSKKKETFSKFPTLSLTSGSSPGHPCIGERAPPPSFRKTAQIYKVARDKKIQTFSYTSFNQRECFAGWKKVEGLNSTSVFYHLFLVSVLRMPLDLILVLLFVLHLSWAFILTPLSVLEPYSFLSFYLSFNSPIILSSPPLLMSLFERWKKTFNFFGQVWGQLKCTCVINGKLAKQGTIDTNFFPLSRNFFFSWGCGSVACSCLMA